MAAFIVASRRGLTLRSRSAPIPWWNISLMVQFGLSLMDRQRLEWPRVAINPITAVPPRLVRTAVLFFTDREAPVRESR